MLWARGEGEWKAHLNICWNYSVYISVSETHKLWKEWKQGNASKKKHLEAKLKPWTTVYKAKCEAEWSIYEDVMQIEDQKDDMIKIARWMIKTNLSVIGD